MRSVAVVLAGGAGHRFGPGIPKQLHLLAGQSLLERCVTTFSQAPGVDELLVVVAAEQADEIRDRLTGTPRLAAVIDGGTARTDSTRHAIEWLAARSSPDGLKVLFHDAARPLVDARTIADCVAALDSWDA